VPKRRLPHPNGGHFTAYTVEEFAERVGVSRATIYNWMSSGLPAMKFGHRTVIPAQEALVWVRSNCRRIDRWGGG